MSDPDRVNLPSTKRCFRPSSAIKRRKVSDSEVIESIEHVHRNPQPHTIDQPQQLKDEHDDESSDAGSADASKSIQMKDHNCFQDCNFTTLGRANTKVHSHPMGLAHVFFSNCVVKVRRGHDLEKIIDLSRNGPVKLWNIQSSGWITSNESLLPAFVFLRWISSME